MSSFPDRLLRIPPPIHSDDPGSPLPGSILLDPYGYLSHRSNGTTAQGSTRDGKAILVTFWAASPPHVSCFTVHCPDLKPFAFCGLPKALYAEDNLVLLHFSIYHEDDYLQKGNNHYFVYQADTENEPPSLLLLPIPHDLRFSDREVVLLRCRDQYMFCFAVLHRIIDFRYSNNQFDLHIYNSKTGGWNYKLMHVDSPKDFSYAYPSIVLAMGGEFGSVGWVDLWRGILVCDLLRDSHSLSYIPLPLPLVPKPLKGYPMYTRNIVVLEGYIKYFEMHYIKPCSNTGRRRAAQGWVAATKKMKISDIGSGNNWEEDCIIAFSEIPVDSPKFVQMLPNLKQEDTKRTLKLLRAGYPALSLHDADTVYIMHTPDPDKYKASVIAVDMSNKTLKDVANFGSGRPLGYTFTYRQSEISKHLDIWSSSRICGPLLLNGVKMRTNEAVFSFGMMDMLALRKSLLELVSHVLETATSLECLTLGTTYCSCRRCRSDPAKCYLVAIKRHFEGKVPSTARLDVEGPCSCVRVVCEPVRPIE